MLSRWRSHASRAWTTTSHELYRGHVGDVYRYSLSVVRDPAEAEDVTQTTFLNAYRAYRARRCGPRHGCSRSPATSASSATGARSAGPASSRSRRPLATPMPDASARARGRDPLGAAGLPARQRTALLLDAVDGRSREEIAAALGIGETTVTGLLIRARGNLRLQLDEGMSCAVATRLRPRLEGSELPDSQRRAAIAHLRNCETCSAETAAPFAVRAARLAPAGAALVRGAGDEPPTGRRRRPRSHGGRRRGRRHARVANRAALEARRAHRGAGARDEPAHRHERAGRSDRRDDARRTGDAVRRRFEAEPDRARGGSRRPSAARRRHGLSASRRHGDRLRRHRAPCADRGRRSGAPERCERGRDGAGDRPRRC